MLHKTEIIPFFLLVLVVGGWLQLGPLGTAATNRPIVPAPSDSENDCGEADWM
jgi:hypothetical protein